MKGMPKGKACLYTNKPVTFASGNRKHGTFLQIQILVRTGSHGMRHPFFYICRKLNVMVEVPERPELNPVLLGGIGMEDGRRAEYDRTEMIRDNNEWGHETYFVVYGSEDAIATLLEEQNLIIKTNGDGFEAVMDVRPPRGNVPPSPIMPSPPAKRENGQRIPTVLQQHEDYRASALYPQNS